MLTEEKTIPGTWYTITCTAAATVTQQIDGETATLATLTESGTTTFRPSASTITVQTDGKYHILPTKAPAAGSSGGSTNLTLADLAELKQSAAEVREAVQTLEGTANVKANNTFSGVNTFNGSLVANGPVTLPGAATVNGTSMQDLQGMQTALSSFLTGIGELSLCTQLQPMRGCHAKTWNDWAALNPTWAQQKTLIFYAPFATEERADMKINAKVPSSVERGIWISPMPPAWDNDNGTTGSNDNIITNALGANICLYCTRSGTIRASMGNCYYVKKATVITPNATTYNTFLSNLGCLASPSNNEMYIFAPKLQTITEIPNSKNTTFDYMPILSAFSIYAPQLATSFYFSRYTKNNIGQTCAILLTLIDGIGTPTTEQPQTITTLTPSDGDEMQTVDGVEKTKKTILMEAAAAKNWEFIFK